MDGPSLELYFPWVVSRVMRANLIRRYRGAQAIERWIKYWDKKLLLTVGRPKTGIISAKLELFEISLSLDRGHAL